MANRLLLPGLRSDGYAGSSLARARTNDVSVMSALSFTF